MLEPVGSSVTGLPNLSLATPAPEPCNPANCNEPSGGVQPNQAMFGLARGKLAQQCRGGIEDARRSEYGADGMRRLCCGKLDDAWGSCERESTRAT